MLGILTKEFHRMLKIILYNDSFIKYWGLILKLLFVEQIYLDFNKILM